MIETEHCVLCLVDNRNPTISFLHQLYILTNYITSIPISRLPFDTSRFFFLFRLVTCNVIKLENYVFTRKAYLSSNILQL